MRFRRCLIAIFVCFIFSGGSFVFFQQFTESKHDFFAAAAAISNRLAGSSAMSMDSWTTKNLRIKRALLSRRNYFLSLAEIPGVPRKVHSINGPWLFYHGDSDPINKSLGTNISSNRLDVFFKRQVFLAKAAGDIGAKYYLIVAPSKATIYMDKLPLWSQIKKKEYTNYDIIMEDSEKKNISTIDLRKILLDARGNEKLLYGTTDTHWNDYGAYLTYQRIISRLQCDFPQLQYFGEKNNLPVKFRYEDGHGIAKMLMLEKRFREKWYYLEFDRNHDKFEITDYTTGVKIPRLWNDVIYRHQSYKVVNHSIRNDLSVLVLRDSFAVALVPYFNRTFKTIYYSFWGRTNEEITRYIQEFKPDMVIFEIAERLVN